MAERRPETYWHLDKRLPVALIFTILVTAFSGWSWVSSELERTDERLTQIERRLTGFAERAEGMRDELRDQGRTVAVLLSRIDDTNRNLDRLRADIASTNSMLREYLERNQRPLQ